jgi:hypothetical protein
VSNPGTPIGGERYGEGVDVNDGAKPYLRGCVATVFGLLAAHGIMG